MKRSLVIAVGVAVAIASTILVWADVRKEREFRRLIAVGDEALATGETFNAIEAYSGAVALKPKSMLAYLKRGDTYRRRRDFGAALRDLGQAQSLDNTAPRPIELLGDANAATGQFATAAAYYQRYLTIDDRAPAVLYKLALSYYRAGTSARAIEPLRRAVALDDRSAEAQLLLGLCLRDRGEREPALRALRRSVEINPAMAAARQELASTYATFGRHQEAIEQLRALAALEPARPERLVSLGLAYAKFGRHEEAVLTLGRAIERYPDVPLPYAALGRVWLQIADRQQDPAALGKAVQALKPAADLAGASSEALALYGRALFLSGNITQSERVLQRAVTKIPVDPLAFRYLGEAARRLGHAMTAREADAKYASLAPPA